MTSSSGYNPLPPTQNGGQASWSDPVSSSSHNDVKGNAFASDGGHQSLDIGAFNHGQPSLKQDSYGGKLETNANNSSALPPEIDPDFLNIPSYFVNTQSVDASNGSLAGSYDLASAAAAAADTSGEFVTANSGPETFADGAVAEEEAVASGSGQGTTGKVKGKRIKLPLACHFCRRRKLKCDGHRPECDNCKKRGETCFFDDYVRRRGPGKRTKEMRDKAAREAEEAGLVNEHSTSGAGPSDLRLEDLNPQDLQGVDIANNHYPGDGTDGEVMDAMGAVMGAGLDFEGAHQSTLDLRQQVENADRMQLQHGQQDGLPEGIDLGEPSTLAELGGGGPRGMGVGQGMNRKGDAGDLAEKRAKSGEH